MTPPIRAEWWRPQTAVESAHPASRLPVAESPTDSPVPFWTLMGFTFILLLAPQQMIPALAPYRIALLTAVVAVITHVYDRLRRGQPIVRLTREMWIAVCLLGWAFLTVPFSYWPGGSLSYLLEIYLKTVVVFWLLSKVVTTPTRLRQVAW